MSNWKRDLQWDALSKKGNKKEAEKEKAEFTISVHTR